MGVEINKVLAYGITLTDAECRDALRCPELALGWVAEVDVS